MKYQNITLLLVLSVLLITVLVSGCTVTITANDALQFNLLKPSDNTLSLITEFESGNEENVAGDVTQKAGSVCAGGACIIY